MTGSVLRPWVPTFVGMTEMGKQTTSKQKKPEAALCAHASGFLLFR